MQQNRTADLTVALNSVVSNSNVAPNINAWALEVYAYWRAFVQNSEKFINSLQ